MYGHPSCSGLGPDKVDSIEVLIASLKHRQALKPNGQFKLVVSGRCVKVNLLSRGLIEFNGEVLSIQDERQIDGKLATTPGYLDDLN